MKENKKSTSKSPMKAPILEPFKASPKGRITNKWTEDELEKSFTRILNHLSNDLMPIVKACQQPGEMNYTKFYEYIKVSEDRAERYARACDDRAEMIFEKMKEIAENPVDGIETMVNDKNGTTITTKDMLGHRRLVVDTYKWTLGKLKPKKYGDRIIADVNNNINDQRIDTSKLTTAELIELKRIYAKAGSKD